MAEAFHFLFGSRLEPAGPLRVEMDYHRHHLQSVVETVDSGKSAYAQAMMNLFRPEPILRYWQSIANSGNDLHGLWWHQALRSQ